MFSVICVWINDWVNNREAGDLRRPLDHYDFSVLKIQWNLNRNWYIFIEENAFESVVWKMTGICLGLNVLIKVAWMQQSYGIGHEDRVGGNMCMFTSFILICLLSHHLICFMLAFLQTFIYDDVRWLIDSDCHKLRCALSQAFSPHGHHVGSFYQTNFILV